MSLIPKPVVCASVDRDPSDPGLWRWIVTVPSDRGDPIFEQCGTANSAAQAKERLDAAMADFDRAWEAIMRELAPKKEL
jgi:hypothetical protein